MMNLEKAIYIWLQAHIFNAMLDDNLFFYCKLLGMEKNILGLGDNYFFFSRVFDTALKFVVIIIPVSKTKNKKMTYQP